MTPTPESESDRPDPIGDRVIPTERSGAPEPRIPTRGGRSRFLLEAARSVFFTLLVFLVVRALVVEAFKIPTSSMEGTLLAGDFLLVNKAVYGAEIPGLGLTLPAVSEPTVGDVVVFHPPHDPQKHYVKRVVGMPGDTLEMQAKRLIRNGRTLEEPYARHVDPDRDAVHPGMAWQARFLRDAARPGRYRPSRDNWGPLVVPSERYFVLGDNRDNSEDSRYWGFVHRESIKGRPWIVYYSSELIGSVGIPTSRDIRWSRIGGRVQ
jgi:signal peptidase I